MVPQDYYTLIQLPYFWIFNTFQLKVLITSVCLSVCLSVRTITSVNILWLLRNSHTLTCVTPAYSLLKMVYVAVILFLQGRTKKSDTLRSMGNIYSKWILEMLKYLYRTKFLYVLKKKFSTFRIENRICSCYTFATGPIKRNPIHYGQWAILIRSEF